MVCSSCGATIADKAIVCYRCGAPTAAPTARSAPSAGRRGSARPAAIASALVAVALAALTLIVPDDSISQIAAGGGAVAAALSTGWLWLRKR
jgi:hypothetical protein